MESSSVLAELCRLRNVGPYLSSDAEPSFGWGYAALALVAFLGVTGYLPYTLMKTAAVIGKLPGLSG
jgi:hypothetical protein